MGGEGRLVDMKAYVNGRLGGIETGACGAAGACDACFALRTYAFFFSLLSTYYEVLCAYGRVVRFMIIAVNYLRKKMRQILTSYLRAKATMYRYRGCFLLTASLRGPGTKKNRFLFGS